MIEGPAVGDVQQACEAHIDGDGVMFRNEFYEAGTGTNGEKVEEGGTVIRNDDVSLGEEVQFAEELLSGGSDVVVAVELEKIILLLQVGSNFGPKRRIPRRPGDEEDRCRVSLEVPTLLFFTTREIIVPPLKGVVDVLREPVDVGFITDAASEDGNDELLCVDNIFVPNHRVRPADDVKPLILVRRL